MNELFDMSTSEDKTLYVINEPGYTGPLISTLQEYLAAQRITKDIENDLKKMQLLGEMMRNFSGDTYTDELDRKIKQIRQSIPD